MEQLIRKRGLRIAVGIALLAAGVWAFLPYATYRVALSAFVNAELTRITTPIRGQVAETVPRKGSFLKRSVKLDLVEAIVPDNSRLVRLENERNGLVERATLLEKQLVEIEGAAKGLDIRIKEYQKAIIERAKVEVEQYEAEVVACRADLVARRNTLGRIHTLAKKGAATANDFDAARAASESTAARCRATEARVKQSRAELTAAQKGVYLQNGSNDAPYSQQQRDRLFLRRQENEIALLQARDRAAQIDQEIIQERQRLAAATRFETTIPGDHVVWSLLASPGSAVVEGQPILDIADCRKRFVVVELSERDFEDMQAGEAALVRLIGSDEWITGTVARVQGAAAVNDQRLLAAHVFKPSGKSIYVEVSLPPSSIPADGSKFCDIGRMAEVRFRRSAPMLTRWFGGRKPVRTARN